MSETVPFLVLGRDDNRCVRCGKVVRQGQYSVHHRILGNRKDNRPSNLIILCGSGTTGCHGWVHEHPEEARKWGYIVTRHGPRDQTTTAPVWYQQLGVPGGPIRTGFFLLGDNLAVEKYREA